MAFAILEVLKWEHVQSQSVRFRGFKNHRQHARPLVFQKMRFAGFGWERLFRYLRPGPISVPHRFAEGDADISPPRLDIGLPGLRLGSDNHWRSALQRWRLGGFGPTRPKRKRLRHGLGN